VITEDQIRAMMPGAGRRLDPHLPYIVPALEAGNITTPRRIAAFMAQLAHESGQFQWLEEIADGWAYEGRSDLGNTEPGDGPRYKGHGPIQVTGRLGHSRCGIALGIDLITYPRMICEPQYAMRSAVWFWNDKMGGLSCLADVDWFVTLTRFINGGTNGLEDRLVHWRRNRDVLGLPQVDTRDEPTAIVAFQMAHHLDADGIVGRATMAKIRETVPPS